MERPSNVEFDAFLSYSRRDAAEANLLQSALERFASPWYRARTSRVFLDTATMSAGGPLREAIERSLESSGALVLLASGASARAPWVNEEVAWWLLHRGTSGVVICALEGAAPRAGAFGVQPELPGVLAEAIGAEEHLWVDLRWMREGGTPDPGDPRMADAAAQVLAALRGVPKDELVGEHLRRRRQTRRLVTTTVATLSVLLASAVVLATMAVGQRNSAVTERMAATSRQLVAQSQSLEEEQPGLARQLLLQAYRLSTSDQAVGALIRSPRLPQEVKVAGTEGEIAASPTAPVIASVEEGQVGLRLLDSGSRLADGPIVAPGAHLAFSPDGAMLAVRDSGTVSLWELAADGSLGHLGSVPLPGEGGRVVFRGHEPVLVVEGAEDLTFVDVADPREPEVIATVLNPPFSERIQLLDSGALLAASATQVPDNIPVPAVVSPVAGRGGDASSLLGGAVAMSPDGLLLASGSADDVVTLWDVADPLAPVVRGTLVGESLGVDSLAFSTDGTALAVGTGAGIVQVWDLDDPTRPVLRERLRTRPESVGQVTFAAGSTVLVAVTADATSEDDTGNHTRRVARVWPVQQSERTVATMRIEGGRTALPTWDPTGQLVVAGFPTRLWDVGRGNPPAALGLLPSIAVSGGSTYAFSADGSNVGTGQPPVRWDVRDPAAPVRLTTDLAVEDPVDLALYGPDRDLLVLGTSFGSIGLWDMSLEPAHLVSDLPGSRSGTQAATFTSDGDVLITLAEEGGALLWDISADEPEVVGRTPDGATSLAVDPDDGTLLVGGAGGDLSLWALHDPASPELITRRSAHVGQVTGVAGIAGGDMLATAGEDGIRLWTFSGGQISPMATLRAGRPFDAPALAFSPDGQLLAASSLAGTEIWDVDVAGLLAQLCSESEPITPDQWREHLPDLSYDPPCAGPPTEKASER